MPSPVPTSVDHPYYYRDHAPHLLTNAYRVFPAWPGTKRPATRRWTAFCREMPSGELVQRWSASSIPYGILLACGRQDQGVSYGAIDLDEDDPERAVQLLALTERIFGKTPLVRVGRPNRRVLLYSLSSGTSTSRNLHQKVQLLADRKCVVLFGTHPETGQPYRWEGPSPLNVLTLPPVLPSI